MFNFSNYLIVLLILFGAVNVNSQVYCNEIDNVMLQSTVPVIDLDPSKTISFDVPGSINISSISCRDENGHIVVVSVTSNGSGGHTLTVLGGTWTNKCTFSYGGLPFRIYKKP